MFGGNSPNTVPLLDMVLAAEADPNTSMAELGDWEIVLFLLDHGVPADYVAPDGNSLRKIVALKQKERPGDAAMTAVVQRLGAR